MKIKVIYWEVDFNGLMLKGVDNMEVEKFDVGVCMEKFFEDMGDWSWSKNGDSFKYDEDDDGIVVENGDGDMRWCFVKI